jgi:hypothetical protein
MISIGDISDGDEIAVTDGWNRARGILYRDSKLNLCVRALGQDIVILKRSPGQRNTLVKGLKIEGHQPQLFKA